MKFNKHYLFYILAIIGVVGTIMVYTNVFMSYNEKKEALQNETVTLKEEIAKLEQQAKEIEKYEEEMKKMNAEMADLMNYFAVYYQMDDILKMVINMRDPFSGEQIDYLKETEIKVMSPELLYSTGTTSTLPTYGLYAKNLDFGLTTTYKGMKDSLWYMYDSDTLKAVSEITFTFDESTGLVKGDIIFDQFFLTGTGKAYVDPTFPYMETGTENLFGETAAFDMTDYFNNYYEPDSTD